MDSSDTEYINPDQKDINEIAENYLIDEDTAERVVDIINEYGVDEEEAIELEELGL